MAYDVRVQGATVLYTASEFDAEMKLRELIESGVDEDTISIYWSDRRLHYTWSAKVSIIW